MMTNNKPTIVTHIDVAIPIEKVWEIWNSPDDIKKWNTANEEWQTTRVENDLRPAGRFLYVMGLKDGSLSFDFEGTYEEVKKNELISYTLDDGRKTKIVFTPGVPVRITETFEPQDTQPTEMQQEFCQSVLSSFKNYAETKINNGQ